MAKNGKDNAGTVHFQSIFHLNSATWIGLEGEFPGPRKLTPSGQYTPGISWYVHVVDGIRLIKCYLLPHFTITRNINCQNITIARLVNQLLPGTSTIFKCRKLAISSFGGHSGGCGKYVVSGYRTFLRSCVSESSNLELHTVSVKQRSPGFPYGTDQYWGMDRSRSLPAKWDLQDSSSTLTNQVVMYSISCLFILTVNP